MSSVKMQAAQNACLQAILAGGILIGRMPDNEATAGCRVDTANIYFEEK